MGIPVNSSLYIINEEGGRNVTRNEGRPSDSSPYTAWKNPAANLPESRCHTSALVVYNMKDVSIWRFVRACGIAPIRIVQLEDHPGSTGSFLVDTSFSWTIYSLALMAFLVPSSLGGLIYDYFKALGGYRTARMETDTDMIVTFLDIITVIVGAGVAIGLNTLRKKTILCLLKEFVEIDVLLGWRGPKTVSRLPVIILALLFFQLFLDIVAWIDLGRGFALALPYFPFYLSYFIMFAEEMAFVNDALALDARFRRLNWRLTVAVTNLDNGTQNQGSENNKKRIYVGNELNSIRRLAVTHARLCEATQTACRRHGIPILVNVMGMFLHLVITAYFFFTQLMSSKGPPSAPYQVTQGLWLVVHLLRLFQIVVPSSVATKEANRTGVIVGNLLNTSTSPATSRQLEFFALQLLHSNANFSACGFFDLDLPLVVSVMGAVTTYLVVLIQFKKTPGKVHVDLPMALNLTGNSLKS